MLSKSEKIATIFQNKIMQKSWYPEDWNGLGFQKRDSANQKEFFTQLKFIFTKFSQNFKTFNV